MLPGGNLPFTSFCNYSMKSGTSVAQRKEKMIPPPPEGVSGLQHPSTADTLRNSHFQFVTGPSLKAMGCFELGGLVFFFVTCLGIV